MRHELNPPARRLIQTRRSLPRKDLRQRLLRRKVIQGARTRRVELWRVYRDGRALCLEGAGPDGEARRLLGALTAQMNGHSGGLVRRHLAKDAVGNGGNACWNHHTDGIEGSGDVQREGGRGKMLTDPLKQEAQAELLVHEKRGAPDAVGEGCIDGARPPRLWEWEEDGEGVLD